MRRTVTVRPIRVIRKHNTVEEQGKIVRQRRSQFFDDEFAYGRGGDVPFQIFFLLVAFRKCRDRWDSRPAGATLYPPLFLNHYALSQFSWSQDLLSSEGYKPW